MARMRSRLFVAARKVSSRVAWLSDRNFVRWVPVVLYFCYNRAMKTKTLTKTQTTALAFLARGGEQIQARTAKALETRGLVTTDGQHMTGSGWVRATITEAGRTEAS